VLLRRHQRRLRKRVRGHWAFDAALAKRMNRLAMRWAAGLRAGAANAPSGHGFAAPREERERPVRCGLQ